VEANEQTKIREESQIEILGGLDETDATKPVERDINMYTAVQCSAVRSELNVAEVRDNVTQKKISSHHFLLHGAGQDWMK
jgi:hypothetical protein